MIRAIAQQAEAERARRAKVINAEGEKQAANMLAEAAETLSSQKQALQLRYLQTLKEVAGERTNTIVFPLPLDLIRPLLETQDAANE
jgi:regulator of protease activity HflC (stomatin/prohibitin superfamily)